MLIANSWNCSVLNVVKLNAELIVLVLCNVQQLFTIDLCEAWTDVPVDALP